MCEASLALYTFLTCLSFCSLFSAPLARACGASYLEGKGVHTPSVDFI